MDLKLVALIGFLALMLLAMSAYQFLGQDFWKEWQTQVQQLESELELVSPTPTPSRFNRKAIESDPLLDKFLPDTQDDFIEEQRPEPTSVVARSSWVYPGAVKVTNGSLETYRTTDQFSQVKQWYKQQIKQSGANVTTQTWITTNGEEQGVLKLAEGNKSITIFLRSVPDGTLIQIKY